MLLFLQPLLRGVQIHAAVVLAANHTPPTLTVNTHLTALRPHVRRPPTTSLRAPRVCLSLRSLSSLAWELLGESA